MDTVTLRARFAEILAPAVNTDSPYAQFMLDALVNAASVEWLATMTQFKEAK